jgi:hypothetical protein
VPPTVSYDKDYNSNTQTFELEPKPLEYTSPVEPHPQHQMHRHSISVIPQGLPTHMTSGMQPAPAASYGDGIRMYQNAPPAYVDQHPQELPQYQAMQSQMVQPDMPYAPQQLYAESPSAAAPPVSLSPPETEASWRNDSISNLSDALGELKIDHTAVGEQFIYLVKVLQPLTSF